jgi:hypothetical protein
MDRDSPWPDWRLRWDTKVPGEKIDMIAAAAAVAPVAVFAVSVFAIFV